MHLYCIMVNRVHILYVRIICGLRNLNLISKSKILQYIFYFIGLEIGKYGHYLL